MKVFFTSIFLGIAALLSFMGLEPSMIFAGSQATSSASLTVTNEISLSGCQGAEVLTPALDLTNQVAVATATQCTVSSNDPDGYQLIVKATNSPAMVRQGGGGADAQFTDATSSWPQLWASLAPSATQKVFAYSAYGDDISGGGSKYGSFAGSCGSSGGSSFNSPLNSRWQGFTTTGTSTMDVTADTGLGRNSRLCLVAMRGSAATLNAGTYTAGIVYTATVK